MYKTSNILLDNQFSDVTIPSFDLLFKEVHVWRTKLDLPFETRSVLYDLLSDQEKNRANRMYFDKDRNSFISAHGVLRCLLAKYSGLEPKEIRFGTSHNNKPYLATDSDRKGLTFNISHSGAFGLYAFGQNREVGIDIEQIRHDFQFEQIANQFFNKNEVQSINVLPETQRKELFFKYWTRKEAFIKSTGEGVSQPLDTFDVSSFSSGELSAILLNASAQNQPKMHGRDLNPGPGYVAAIVSEGDNWSILCREFSISLFNI